MTSLQPTPMSRVRFICVSLTMSVLMLLGPISVCHPMDLSPIVPNLTLEGLCFDAVLELKAPISSTTNALFARYWVEDDCLRVEVGWCEPHWNEINYAYYPVSLLIRSGTSEFAVANSVRQKNWAHKKPGLRRSLFRHMNNEYPIDEMRYAESEYLGTRVYKDDLGNLSLDSEKDAEQRTRISVGVGRSFSALETTGKNDLVSNVALLDSTGGPMKSIDYIYDNIDGKTRLQKQIVTLFERRIMAAGLDVNLVSDQGPQSVSMYPIKYHRGNRQCLVQYGRTEIPGLDYPLPTSVNVYTGDGKDLLRRIAISNHRVLSSTETVQLESPEPTEYSAFSEDEMKCRDMLFKYWLRSADEVEPEDREVLMSLRNSLLTKSTRCRDIGGRLKNLYMRVMTDMMLDECAEVNLLFREYIALLRQANLQERTVLHAGCEFIALAVKWRKLDLADTALSICVDGLCNEENRIMVCDYARWGIEHGRPWPSYCLLAKLITLTYDGEARFELTYLMCVALQRFMGEMATSPDDRGVIGSYHPLHVFSTPAELRQRLDELIRECLMEYSSIGSPGKRHTLMKSEIEKMMNDLR